MCTYQTLYYHGPTGYVIRCNECDHIQLAFKNIALTFYPPDFESFRIYLQNLFHSLNDYNSHSIRSIAVPMPCDGLKLLLSKKELSRFISMLDAADTEIKSLALISLFPAP